MADCCAGEGSLLRGSISHFPALAVVALSADISKSYASCTSVTLYIVKPVVLCVSITPVICALVKKRWSDLDTSFQSLDLLSLIIYLNVMLTLLTGATHFFAHFSSG